MIKRVMVFSQPAYLHLSKGQMVIELTENKTVISRPVEDLGLIVLENKHIIISNALIEALAANNTAMLTCNEKHIPTAISLPIEGNTLHAERLNLQIAVNYQTKNALWKQVIRQKIRNQATVLKWNNYPAENMEYWASKTNLKNTNAQESRAAVYYWKTIFGENSGFKRERYGEPPNNMLNYAYAILRAITARAISATGLHNALGIQHKNRYNAFCLSDDMMEPYRPFVDIMVCELLMKYGKVDLDTNIKRELLTFQQCDVMIEGQKHPLMIAVEITIKSLLHCYEGTEKKLKLPEFPN